jgi:hypothetical protein
VAVHCIGNLVGQIQELGWQSQHSDLDWQILYPVAMYTYGSAECTINNNNNN